MMTMHTTHSTDRWLIALGLAAAAALAAALALQFIGGYAPCHLCVLERYPYLVVMVACGLGLWLKWPRLALGVSALALVTVVGLAVFHVGVEQGWFALPESCAAVGRATSLEDLKAQLHAAPARCDQVPLALLGLSLAAWNGIYAAAMLVAALLGLRRSFSS